jgi:hypothetical protein
VVLVAQLVVGLVAPHTPRSSALSVLMGMVGRQELTVRSILVEVVAVKVLEPPTTQVLLELVVLAL